MTEIFPLANEWSRSSPNLLHIVDCEEEIPPIEDFGDYIDNPPEPLKPLIEGVLNEGAKFSLNGASKSWKSWAGIDLAISIATGVEWFSQRTYCQVKLVMML